ncbi:MULTISPECIES: UDP-N-acetylmuramoyl-L-alanyl-D-glutamate--2,6-diaminopimelate ligase [Dehalobacter]|uniref:UDP-N-acetylmuramoyl-L-alanyl-D-glutamate--2,6-diaminopimelate ligase n=2 Tax=Dehalobacter restrictus TaxID=55583 RepID=A0A857DM54_9FIRM|nr:MULTISPECIES: UDP-N-acetylmuramoyl-L-alanyl-D-glutamate--2,6-diaminopimelate ligase [Dehalobacter]AHF10571.1 UDP-N-acetylmuramyl peptide synthase [Dehalobacter restrictus DSM 9455]MCG1026460.1 UDP-N-acetylmuramoyl-L-alanyl-D-glutamate--2,6-diaminopimelate ligase [Dehalobacter sp.]MDJ0305956.1 UDP-N-acetylmuramoyl-L-alanyl-D-glutamate--2,6-diaminopimelate ligase [Dehalobacter sp.]OCZ52391.1 UDP-N-acetylmuramoyl-L-alanyl-D-glutamate--2,6-diaminopimelate ligase [Dehalobacter sp. TeCB1]QHA01196
MSSFEKTLAEIIDTMKQVEVLGDTQTVINGIAHDSRTVSPGNLYVCIRGYQADGHAFAEAAVRAGATALAVEEFLPLAVPQLKFTDTRKAMGFLAAEVFGKPSDRLELVGVTGTNGKTTVTHLIERIVQQSGKKTGLIGTLGSRIGNNAYPGQHTTPESTEIQLLLAEMVAENVDLAVMEVSSHALDLGRVNGCVFNAGIFTNLTQDHLDYHKDMQEYLKAKALLFSGLNGGKAGQLAVLNADDGSCVFLKEQAGCRVVTYGVDNEADYRAVNIRLSDRGVEFDVLFHGKSAELFYSTPGKFSVYNVLAAIAWALESGYPTEIVMQALHSIKGVPGRFESIRKGQPFLVIVDYAHTPDGLENVLRTAREITAGKLITVFGCGGDRDRKKRPLMGEAASRFSDYIVVTSDNPRTEDPDEIIEDIIPGLKSANYKVIKDRRSAIDEACMAAGSGDTVLIAGKGHEDYQILGTEKIHFDDREEADKVLRRLGYVE